MGKFAGLRENTSFLLEDNPGNGNPGDICSGTMNGLGNEKTLESAGDLLELCIVTCSRNASIGGRLVFGYPSANDDELMMWFS